MVFSLLYDCFPVPVIINEIFSIELYVLSSPLERVFSLCHPVGCLLCGRIFIHN